MSFLSDLKWRGLVKDISSETKIKKAEFNHKALYCGFDPTATSLHVGHLIPITMLERARRAGLKPIALLGGATGMIGDPSFKSKERVLLSPQEIEKNIKAIENQLKTLIPGIKIANNKKWLGQLNLINFLRDVAKNFNVPYLLQKEAITKRLATGISVTEFLYPLLQAYDFYWLYKHENCRIEVGGSDQWGNITSGLDFIRHQVGNDNSAAGITIPLLLQKNGEKFGKTMDGTPIWLDAKKTSPYHFYQFWLNQKDEEALILLKFLTFLSKSEIQKLSQLSHLNPSQRLLQKTLARELTLFVHGVEGLKIAEKLSEAFFKGTVHNLDKITWKIAIQSVPRTKISAKHTVIEALLLSNIISSKREAHEFIRDKSISINGHIISDFNQFVTDFKGNESHLFLVKRGKRNYFVWEIA